MDMIKPEQPLPDEWVVVFDDMVRVQQRTERERDELRRFLLAREAECEDYQGKMAAMQAVVTAARSVWSATAHKHEPPCDIEIQAMADLHASLTALGHAKDG